MKPWLVITLDATDEFELPDGVKGVAMIVEDFDSKKKAMDYLYNCKYKQCISNVYLAKVKFQSEFI